MTDKQKAHSTPATHGAPNPGEIDMLTDSFDDRPVAGFTDAGDHPELQAAIRARLQDDDASDAAEARTQPSLGGAGTQPKGPRNHRLAGEGELCDLERGIEARLWVLATETPKMTRDDQASWIEGVMEDIAEFANRYAQREVEMEAMELARGFLATAARVVGTQTAADASLPSMEEMQKLLDNFRSAAMDTGADHDGFTDCAPEERNLVAAITALHAAAERAVRSPTGREVSNG